jgi:hypothetical protein
MHLVVLVVWIYHDARSAKRLKKEGFSFINIVVEFEALKYIKKISMQCGIFVV